jgi:hypothetical protein
LNSLFSSVVQRLIPVSFRSQILLWWIVVSSALCVKCFIEQSLDFYPSLTLPAVMLSTTVAVETQEISITFSQCIKRNNADIGVGTFSSQLRACVGGM